MPRPYTGALAVLFLLVAPLRAASRDTWVEVRSQHFVVVSNAGERAARRTAIQFEQIRSLFHQALAVTSIQPAPKLTILALKNESSLRSLLPGYWRPGHAHPAGIFSHRLNQFYIALELDAPGTKPYSTLYHEYFHSITTPYFPSLPAWLAEGLADFYGRTQITDLGAEMGLFDEELVRQLKHGRVIPLDVLFQVDHASPYYNEQYKTSVFYAESWALAHYLIVGDHGAHRHLLFDYLAAMTRGATALEAAHATFGDLPALQAELSRYVESAASVDLLTPPPQTADAELQARPISRAEAMVCQGGFLAVQGQTARAIALLREVTAEKPNSASLRQNLALAFFFAEQRAEAAEAASRAITLDPSNSTMRYIRAYLAFHGSMLQANAQMESDLRVAVTSDANFAPPYSLLAAYLAAQDRDLSHALEYAHRAVSLEPGNSMYQLVWAKVLGRLDRYKESHTAAQRARQLATEAADRDAADHFLDFLEHRTAVTATVSSGKMGAGREQ